MYLFEIEIFYTLIDVSRLHGYVMYYTLIVFLVFRHFVLLLCMMMLRGWHGHTKKLLLFFMKPFCLEFLGRLTGELIGSWGLLHEPL